jgi:hypothetical protein
MGELGAGNQNLVGGLDKFTSAAIPYVGNWFGGGGGGNGVPGYSAESAGQYVTTPTPNWNLSNPSIANPNINF